MNMYWIAFKSLMQVKVYAKLYELSIFLLSLVTASFLVGWMLFGWWLFPVQWEPDRFNNAPAHSQVNYVHLLSEWYAYTENDQEAHIYLNELDNVDMIACYLASQEQNDMARKARYIKVAYLKNGMGCIERR